MSSTTSSQNPELLQIPDAEEAVRLTKLNQERLRVLELEAKIEKDRQDCIKAVELRELADEEIRNAVQKGLYYTRVIFQALWPDDRDVWPKVADYYRNRGYKITWSLPENEQSRTVEHGLIIHWG